jgi:hypothetical protein
MSELWMMLMHLIDWHWFSVELWQSEVSLIENVLLVKLWNALHIRSGPSIEHHLSKVRFVLNGSIG